jgi:hypothetical protein
MPAGPRRRYNNHGIVLDSGHQLWFGIRAEIHPNRPIFPGLFARKFWIATLWRAARSMESSGHSDPAVIRRPTCNSAVTPGSYSDFGRGPRDLNPGRHGPEIWAISTTETVFEGFEIDCSIGHAGWTCFEPSERPGLLHELLHENARISRGRVGGTQLALPFSPQVDVADGVKRPGIQKPSNGFEDRKAAIHRPP